MDDDSQVRKGIALRAAKEGAALAIEAYKEHVHGICRDFRSELATLIRSNKTKILLARTKHEGQVLEQMSHLLMRDSATSKKLEGAIIAMGSLALEATTAAIENSLVKPEEKN